MYDRKWIKAKLPKEIKFSKDYFKTLKLKNCLQKILTDPNIADKEWIWNQYDHTVMGDTIQKPGGNAGVVRVHGTNKAVAASVDSSATYCHAHPLTGGKQVVCESWRNMISVGAKPIAITNCLNFGNPEKEKNMGEFVECVEGISEASKYLNYPVVSGNVSFYNETKDKGIKPTPSIGGIGLLSDYKKMITMELKNDGNYLYVIGKTEGHLNQSVFARNILSEFEGPPPEINLFNEKQNGMCILNLKKESLIETCHDVSLGGILTAVSKMSIKGNKGVKLFSINGLVNKFEYFFGEDQGRYIVEIKPENLDKVEDMLKKDSIHFDKLGIIESDQITYGNDLKISIDDIREGYKNWLKEYMVN